MATILIVDDEFASLQVLALLFEGEGFVALKAPHGGDALEVLQREQVDVIVSDIDMPIVDGLELLERLRALGSRVPVVLMSANQPSRDALAPPARAFIAKPLRFDDLLRLVREALHS